MLELMPDLSGNFDLIHQGWGNVWWLAQQIEDPDVFGQMRDAWANFVQSGQIWALIIGVIFGYLIRSITA